MNILFIGGAGLIGSELCYLLQEDKHNILILDNFTSNYKEHSDFKGIEIVTGNACTFSNVNRVFSFFKPDVVFCFADSLYDKEGIYNSSLESFTAVSIASTILKCLDIYKVKYVFFGSSCEVYKGGSKRCLAETSTVGHYSYTGSVKYYIENLFYLASKQYGFVFTSFRFFQIIGNRKYLNPKYDIVSFFNDCVLNSKGVVIVGPDLYIDILSFTEAAKASYLVFKRVVEGNFVGPINIASGNGIKIIDVYNKISLFYNKEPDVFKTPVKRQIRSLIASTKKLASIGINMNFSADLILKDFLNDK
jgi:nucleoside-diphosphate-sugar epimerase